MADAGMESSDLLEHTKMECDSSSPELDAELAEEHKLKGNVAYKAGDYTAARDYYSKAIFHNPNCASYWSNRSATLMMLENFGMALEDCTQALKLDETYTKGYLRAAKCHLMTGNPSLSIDYYKKVLAVEKRNKQALAELEVSQGILKNLEQAAYCIENKQYRMGVVMLQRCLEEAPQCLVFRTKLAEALVLSKSYNEAHTIANDLLKSDQNNATALYVKAMCYYYQDVSDRAMQFFQRALRVDPDHTKSRLAMKQSKRLLKMKEDGNAFFKQGKHADAYKTYTEALEIDSHNTFTNAKLYCNRALVGAKIGKLSEAIQDCTNAIELDPTYIRAYQRRAKLYQENEDHDEAVRDYDFIFQKESSSENRANVKEAKRLLKISKRKDYYKILGLSKNVNGDDIKKAYHRCALLHHPDRHASAEDSVREDEERIFKEVSEAYSVLSDTEKKNRYDNGQDLDEMSNMDFDPSDLFSSMFGGGGGGGGFSHGGRGPTSFSFGYCS